MKHTLEAKVDALLVETIVELHAIFNDISKVTFWMNTKNLNFGGFSPITLISKGRGQKVLEFVKGAKDME